MQYPTVFAALLLVGIFLLDLLTPIGYAVWILYFLPILIASKTVKSRYFYLFPAISTLLTTTGFLLHFPFVDIKPVITRRIIGIFTIWAVTLIIGQRRKAERDLEELSHELESRVEERTRELTQANIALHMEMTERKRVEEEQRESEHLYRTLFDSIDEGFCIIEVIFDEEDKPVDYLFLEINPSFEKQTGLIDAKGKRMRELAPKHEEHWFEIYGQIALTGQPARFENRAEQLHRWYDVYAFRFGQPENRQVAILFNDISERKRTEEALIRAKEEWEGTFDSVPDLIAILDDQHRIVRVNRAMAERLNMQPAECKGLTCYTIIHQTLTMPESCPHAKMLADGREHHMEMREASLDGDFMVSTTPLIGADGKMRAVHVARDITEQKQAADEIERLNTDLSARAAELEAANLELEAFNYTVAHDLRKPLTVVNGYCQAVRDMCSDKLGEECKDYLQEAYDGTLRMNQLITALLNFSRMAHAEMHRERFDLSALAQAAATELKQSELQRRVTFRIPEGIVVDGDRDLLRVVLNNLLGNAWKYTAMSGEAIIEFGITEIDSNLAYFVRDNGPGFDTADAPKLFTPFKRLAGAEKYRGFGIGLATVERIIQRHGGKIWAEGGPGKGATFYFTLTM